MLTPVRPFHSRVGLGFLLAALTLTAACKRNPPADLSSLNQFNTSNEDSASLAANPADMDKLRANFERVHFGLDSSTLSDDAKDALAANAGILQRYPSVRVEVQGHADERGTIDYNLALGQRRARSVVTYLQRQGVSPNRLEVVSYGEERPLERGGGEVAWSKNRRAEFRVLEGEQHVASSTK